MDIENARVESSIQSRNEDSKIDENITKIHYPRFNNDKILSFVLQQEPNLCLELTSVEIHLRVKVPSSHFPENGFAHKLFRNMSVEINSQLITSNKCRFF